MTGWGDTRDAVVDAFDEVCTRMRAEHPEDVYGRMFGANGLALPNRKFYAFCPGSGTVAKLPAGRVAELIASGEGAECAPSGRPMREWVKLGTTDVDELAALVAEARAFVLEVTGRVSPQSRGESRNTGSRRSVRRA